MNIVDPIVVDFETYYDSECSVKANKKRGWVGGNYHYVVHPKFYAYMLTWYDLTTSAKGCITNREDFPTFLDAIKGRTFVGVNCGFDAAVGWRIMSEHGVSWQPFNTLDMGDLSSYLQAPRSLAGMMEHLLGIHVNKSMRDFMSGKHYNDLSETDKQRMIAYGMGDVEYPAQVYRQFLHLWPDIERWLSDHTRRQNWAGVHIDTDYVDLQLDKVQSIKRSASEKIPWLLDVDNEDKPLSPKALAKWCRSVNLEPPESMAEDDPACQDWERINGEKFPVVAAMRDFRKANTYQKKLQLIQDLLRPDGTIPFDTKYASAPHTLRWGANQFNYQSLPKPDLPGGQYAFADLRGCLVPTPGHVFIPSDLSNIEARCLPWLAGDFDLLATIATGVDIYEAFARRGLGYADPRPLKSVDKSLREVSKVCVLQLGFQSGAKKFCFYIENNLTKEQIDRVRRSVVKIVDGATVSVPETNMELAQRLVTLYRSVNFKIKGLWDSLHLELNTACQLGKTLEIQLPNGGMYRYFNLHQRVSESRPDMLETIGLKCRGTPPRNVYGGKIAENLTQRTARDVIAEAIFNLNQAGFRDRFNVHDEIVSEVPEDQAVEAAKEIEAIMSRTPKWLPSCPIAAETSIVKRYCK